VACLELQPTTAADVWALGCLAHFCLEARPRIEADDDDAAKALIRAFRAKDAVFASTTPRVAVDFEVALLEPDPARRPTLVDVAATAFLADLDLRTLYRRPAPKLDRAGSGTATRIVPPHDAAWAQRQYSRIWAPLGSGSDLPGAAAAAAVDGLTPPTTGAYGDLDLLGPWVQVHAIPDIPADRNMPFFPDVSPSALRPPTPASPAAHDAPVPDHHDEPLDAIVEAD